MRNCVKCERHYGLANQCPNHHSNLGILIWEGMSENDWPKELLLAADYKEVQGNEK